MKALIDGLLVDRPDPTIERVQAAQAVEVSRESVRPAKPISGTDFLARLSIAEYAAIMNAAHVQLATNEPQLSIWIDMLRLRCNIVVTDPAAVAAKAFLIAQNLLTQERADIIFAGC